MQVPPFFNIVARGKKGCQTDTGKDGGWCEKKEYRYKTNGEDT